MCHLIPDLDTLYLIIGYDGRWKAREKAQDHPLEIIKLSQLKLSKDMKDKILGIFGD